MLWTVLLAIVALIWVVVWIRTTLGIGRLPHLREVQPLADADCPSVSILFSARDEALKLPKALATLMALDYPRLEVVAVNDRSADATGSILAEAAARDPRLKVVHVTELPPGWLGKPHGLHRAYEASSGEWLIFTDADVHFAPDLLRRATALAQRDGTFHLALLGKFEVVGFWEHTIVAFMGLMLMLAEPWEMSNPRSRRYAGGGYFQMIARSAYQAIGGHRRLAMEVVDDMRLAGLVKRSGVPSCVGVAEEQIRVRWHDGLLGSARNVEKNFFASLGFRTWLVALIAVAVLVIFVLPLLTLPFTTGWAQAIAGLAAGAPMLLTAVIALRLPKMGASPVYGLTIPLGALLLTAMLVNSTVKTLRQGGIVWRDTFYPLDELRKGIV